MKNQVPIQTIFSNNLKRIRKTKEVSRKQLADIVGVTEISFGKYERGLSLPPLDKILKMAEFLGVSVSDLIGDNQEYTEKQIFDYRLKRAWRLTEFLEPNFNFGGLTGSDTPNFNEDGQIVVYSAQKIIYEKGVVSVIGDINVVAFTEKDFVRVMEQAEQNALYRQISLNSAFREIVFNE